jgi:hypothetical protein
MSQLNINQMQKLWELFHTHNHLITLLFKQPNAGCLKAVPSSWAHSHLIALPSITHQIENLWELSMTHHKVTFLFS